MSLRGKRWEAGGSRKRGGEHRRTSEGEGGLVVGKENDTENVINPFVESESEIRAVVLLKNDYF